MLDLYVRQIIIQIIGFVVMLWIMKKYAWQPLLDVMAARRRAIQEEFDAISAARAEAMQLKELYQEKLKEIDKEARKKIQESHKMGMKIQEDAHVAAKDIVHKAKIEIAGEILKAKSHLKNDIVDLVVHATEKMLNEKLDAPSQKRLIQSFIEEAKL